MRPAITRPGAWEPGCALSLAWGRGGDAFWRAARLALPVVGRTAGASLRQYIRSMPRIPPPPGSDAAGLGAWQADSLGNLPQPADDSGFVIPGAHSPWLTLAILALLVGVFAAEQLLAVTPGDEGMSPSIETLMALGGLNRTLVAGGGEWYRLFTAPLLHTDIGHILCNGVALLLVGMCLERLIGRAWFLAVFLVGALGGSLLSLALDAPSVVSVGASGAIMALFAAGFTSSYHLPEGTRARKKIQSRSLGVLVPSLLPLATATEGAHIDYGAHIGGAVAGAAIAGFLLVTWPQTHFLPRFRGAAGILSVVGIALVALSVGSVADHYPLYRIIGR
jgi:membrane associated rhomboid family serine protease